MLISNKLIDILKSVSPKFVRRFLRLHISFRAYDAARLLDLERQLALADENFPESKYCLGIIKEVTGAHSHYVAACRKLRVSYKILDIMSDDWVEVFGRSRCDAFLVWPSMCGTTVKAVYDMRLKLLEEDMGAILFPTWKECWLTEYKLRLRDWLQIHNIPHPKTWVFYREHEAEEFCATATFPLVIKTTTGASGSGVRIVKSRGELRKMIKTFFGRGLATGETDCNDRHRGYLFAQEYIRDAQEWRMVRVGDSFFGYRKEKGANDKCSGSHRWSWLDPGKKRLDALRMVTEKGGFRSMDVDFLETTDGRLLVNECQTVFGCTTPAIQMKVNDVEGRYLWEGGEWVFEAGRFSDDHVCALRVQYILQRLSDVYPRNRVAQG